MDINVKYFSSILCNLSDFDENGDEYRVFYRIYFKDVVKILLFIDSLKIEIIYKELVDFL